MGEYYFKCILVDFYRDRPSLFKQNTLMSHWVNNGDHLEEEVKEKNTFYISVKLKDLHGPQGASKRWVAPKERRGVHGQGRNPAFWRKVSIKNSAVLAVTVGYLEQRWLNFNFEVSVVLLGDMIPQPLFSTNHRSNSAHTAICGSWKRTKRQDSCSLCWGVWAEVESKEMCAQWN